MIPSCLFLASGDSQKSLMFLPYSLLQLWPAFTLPPFSLYPSECLLSLSGFQGWVEGSSYPIGNLSSFDYPHV